MWGDKYYPIRRLERERSGGGGGWADHTYMKGVVPLIDSLGQRVNGSYMNSSL